MFEIIIVKNHPPKYLVYSYIVNFCSLGYRVYSTLLCHSDTRFTTLILRAVSLSSFLLTPSGSKAFWRHTFFLRGHQPLPTTGETGFYPPSQVSFAPEVRATEPMVCNRMVK